MTRFHLPCPQVSAFDQTPSPCGRPHFTSCNALWSGSVITGAVDIPHLTRTTGGLTCGSSKLRLCGRPLWTAPNSHCQNIVQCIMLNADVRKMGGMVVKCGHLRRG